MQPIKIVTLRPKTLVGMSVRMSYLNPQTSALWQTFRPRAKEIEELEEPVWYSVQVLDKGMSFADFKADTLFHRWAAKAVTKVMALPEGMASYKLEGGLYAVFLHQGLPQDYPQTYQAIFGEWLPKAPYILDVRDHFEVLPPDYNPFDPQACEEIWVPIRANL